MRMIYKKYFKSFIFVGLFLPISVIVLSQLPEFRNIFRNNPDKVQFPKKIPIPKIPGLDKILKREPAITTDISDAVTGVPFLDDFELSGASPMSILPRTSEGGFVLEKPGAYVFEAQSYCLAPGKYSPSGKHGYLYASLKGPLASVIRNVLYRSFSKPGISQQDIQSLLWAIISRTKVSNMSRHMQEIALKLLTPKEIFELNGGALGLILEALLDKAFDKVQPRLRDVLEAEARLRQLLTEAHATYEELESVAVRFGIPPFDKSDLQIPEGRWSYHHDGYFIRFFPKGFRQMVIELYFPEQFKVERDELARIVSITNNEGNRIETEYNDMIDPLSIPGEPFLKAYAFRSIRLESLDLDNPGKKVKTEWNDIGWTFIGVLTGEGHVDISLDRFSGLKERHKWAKAHKMELNELERGVTKLMGRTAHEGIPQSSMEEIMSLGYYTIALKEAIGSSSSDQERWFENPVNIVKKAWQYAVSRSIGFHIEKPVFDPAGDPVSGCGSEQPIANSSRGTDKFNDCSDSFEKDEKKLEEGLMNCVKDHCPPPLVPIVPHIVFEEEEMKKFLECAGPCIDAFLELRNELKREFKKCIGYK